MKKESGGKLSLVIEILIWTLMAVDVVLMVALPWLVTATTLRQPGDTLYRDYLIILYASGVMAELVLWQCRGVMHRVSEGNPFVNDTVRRLRVIAVECLALALMYAVFVCLLGVVKFFLALLALVFAFIGLVLLVFAALFRQAAAYKEENDMTI